MTIRLHAQPYDCSAVGFYFESFEEYQAKTLQLRRVYEINYTLRALIRYFQLFQRLQASSSKRPSL